MDPSRTQPSWPVRFAHSIWLRIAGFALGFIGAALIVAGLIVGVLGIFGGLLVRARPDTSQNINYDPSTFVLLAPIPVLAGIVVLLVFAWIARRVGH